MTGIERLRTFVRSALPGTMVPVESLRDIVDEIEENPTSLDRGLSLDEVAIAAAKALGKRRPPSTAGVRKWINHGLRGVKLKAYPVGRGYGVLASELTRFVEEVRASRRPVAGAHLPPARPTDPADEIDAFEQDDDS